MEQQQTLAAKQFGQVAQAYLGSAVHASGPDLLRLKNLAQGQPGLHVLDMGCGAGHASFALAEGGAEVIAYDVSPEMLAVVEGEKPRRGLTRLHTQPGPAERLPFQDACFDLVVSRLSAHHWADVPAALREISRVLRPGGNLIMIDIVGPEIPQHDTLLQTIEILRDPSHVRDYRISEWQSMFRCAGFAESNVDVWSLPIEFKSWTARMRTSELRAQAIKDMFAQATDESRRHFLVSEDCSFSIHAAWMQTQSRASLSG
jgi:ubiquinone/menaquinone biosynthesis C-methylase UbiE